MIVCSITDKLVTPGYKYFCHSLRIGDYLLAVSLKIFSQDFTKRHGFCSNYMLQRPTLRTRENSEIEHSIVLDHSRIVDVPSRIEDSIIGREVEITYSPIKPKAFKMTLGDHSRVGLL